MRNVLSKLWWASILSIVLPIALVWPTTSAAGAADSFTLHLSNVTKGFNIYNSCIGPAHAILTYDAVIHVTEKGDMYHTTVHMHGDAVVDPLYGPTFSGHFAETQVLNLNRNNAVSTFTVTQVGPPNLQFHITAHMTLDAAGGDLFVFNVACGP